MAAGALNLKIILSTEYSNSLNIFLEILNDFCLLTYFINNNYDMVRFKKCIYQTAAGPAKVEDTAISPMLHAYCLLQMRFSLLQLRRDITCRLSSNPGGHFLRHSITIDSEI